MLIHVHKVRTTVSYARPQVRAARAGDSGDGGDSGDSGDGGEDGSGGDDLLSKLAEESVEEYSDTMLHYVLHVTAQVQAVASARARHSSGASGSECSCTPQLRYKR